MIARPGPARNQTTRGVLDEYRRFSDLLGSLDAHGWTRATRCSGWQVRDVAGHVVGQALDVLGGKPGTRTPDEQAAAMRDRPPAALAADLLGAADALEAPLAGIDDAAWTQPGPVAGLTLGQAVQTLQFDAYVHAADIRAAIGDAAPGPGLTAALDYVLGVLTLKPDAAADPRIAAHLTRPAAGFTAATGIDAHDFVLAATGRLDPSRLKLPNTMNLYG